MNKNHYTLSRLLDRIADQYPNNPAIISEGNKINYKELRATVNKFAAGLLALGVKKGDRVALLMDNRPEWLVVDFAVTSIGAVLVPINIRYRSHELNYLLNNCRPSILILIDAFLNTNFIEMIYCLSSDRIKKREGRFRLEKFPFLKYVFCLSKEKHAGIQRFEDIFDQGARVPVDEINSAKESVNENDLAQIIYTSGSTAAPKGAMLTQYNLCKNGEAISDRMRVTHEDKFWMPIPLSFSFASANAIMNALSKGACLVLQRLFEPGEALKLIEAERCTVMYANPTIYLPMSNHPILKEVDISSLKKGIAMGTPQNITRLVEDMGVEQICTGYGMTETTAISTLSDPLEPLDLRIYTNGTPFPGVSIAIKDPDSERMVPTGEDGEFRIKGYNIMRGYLDDPEKSAAAFDEEGYLRTGDIGMIREDGYVVFKGRYKDMLKTSGINVSTLEVETFLETYPDVQVAHVVGIPDELKEEVGAAYIRLSPGSTCSERDILNFCKGRIASYKIPKYIRFVSEFPLTSSGKVKKAEIRKQAIEELK